MANVLFPLGREGFLDGSIDWDTDDIRLMLVKQGFYFYDAADEFLQDTNPAGCDNGRSGAFTGKTVSLGVADADDVLFTATDADPCDAIIIFKHTGSDATARLIAYLDTPGYGLPFTPSGASKPVTVAWANTANKIFML